MNQKETENSGLSIRYTEKEDEKFLREWLSHPETKHWFSMDDQAEIDDAANRWVAFHRYKCSLTSLMHNVPCGIATLYLQPYKKLVHQCEFGIVVGEEFRNQGVGGYLLEHIMRLAKEQFHIELIHLQVNGENPAMRLYKRYGFREFGRQSRWIKEDGVYVSRVFMERFL